MPGKFCNPAPVTHRDFIKKFSYVHFNPSGGNVGCLVVFHFIYPDEVVVIDLFDRQVVAFHEHEAVEYCELNLPRYKRPKHFVFDKVPRNPTGKIEKPKLREKYREGVRM